MRQGAVRYVSARLAITVLIVGAVLIVGLSVALHAPIVTGLAIYGFMAVPICLAAILSRVRQLSQATERTVFLKEGVVTVTTPSGTDSHPLGRMLHKEGSGNWSTSNVGFLILAALLAVVFVVIALLCHGDHS